MSSVNTVHMQPMLSAMEVFACTELMQAGGGTRSEIGGQSLRSCVCRCRRLRQSGGFVCNADGSSGHDTGRLSPHNYQSQRRAGYSEQFASPESLPRNPCLDTAPTNRLWRRTQRRKGKHLSRFPNFCLHLLLCLSSAMLVCFRMRHSSPDPDHPCQLVVLLI